MTSHRDQAMLEIENAHEYALRGTTGVMWYHLIKSAIHALIEISDALREQRR